MELDEIFFGEKATELDEVEEISSGTNLLSPPTVITNSIKDIGDKGEKINYYSSPLGQDSLRESIKLFERVLSDFNMPESYKCVVTSGAADGLRIVFDFLKKRGFDNVLTLGPQYSIVFQTISLSGLGLIESSGCEGKFLPNPKSIDSIINTRDIDILFLTQPNNPTGEMYSEKEFKEIVTICKKNNIFLVYEKLGADIQIDKYNLNNYYGMILSQENFWNNTIIIDSFSKRRSISGLRLGYILGDKGLESFANLIRFGDCPPLIGNDGVCRDLIVSSIIHLKEKNKCSINEAIRILQRKVDLSKFKEFITNPSLNQIIEKHYEEIVFMYKTINNNLKVFQIELNNYIEGITSLDGGSNCLVGFENKGLTEKENALFLYEQGKVISYPLGCFFIDQTMSKNISDKFWIRLSTAMYPEQFEEIIVRLKKTLGGGLNEYTKVTRTIF
ncbi:pyridoxal phosphate-dependent aminotransferase [Evansella clarkii]|uniref:pyridoxal phosphate-dependent aminotransferase n=1 Tax=Evansella clarkii TaxID=79879 RepID=UPI00142FF643|nr:pyridoxal phosphate-dependent aminotransferase [Evansella clarkii]